MRREFDEMDMDEFDRREALRRRRREQNRRKKLRQIRNRKIALLVVAAILLVSLGVMGISFIAGGSKKNNKEKEEAVTEVVPTQAFNSIPVVDLTEFKLIQEEKNKPAEVAVIDDMVYSAEFTDSTKGFNDEMTSSYGILIDITTGQVVASRSGKDTMVPASMTKVLTVLTAARHIEESKLDDVVTISQAAGDYAFSHDCSIVGFSTGEKVKVRDLFYGTILSSGGDAAYALAEYVAGDMDTFVDMMNETVEELGLSKTSHFTNPVGIYDSNLYTTPYDMCMIMWAAENNEFLSDVLGAHTYTTTITEEHPEGITISNWFLRRIEDKDAGVFVAGGKTGFVNESGSCAVSYAESEDGHRYLCCTGNAHSAWRAIYDHVAAYNQR